MKTVEELKGMTHEDLVRLVQELSEKVQVEESSKNWHAEYRKMCSQNAELRDVIKKMSNLL